MVITTPFYESAARGGPDNATDDNALFGRVINGRSRKDLVRLLLQEDPDAVLFENDIALFSAFGYAHSQSRPSTAGFRIDADAMLPGVALPEHGFELLQGGIGKRKHHPPSFI